ncbi:hypothetical protein GCM10027417_03400 [Glutamicibacter endophyticus]
MIPIPKTSSPAWESGLINLFCDYLRDLHLDWDADSPKVWSEHISAALLESIFSPIANRSIAATSDLHSGLENLVACHPKASENLNDFLALGVSGVSEAVGFAVDSGRNKYQRAMAVAENFVTLELFTVCCASEFKREKYAHKHSYLDVSGLGNASYNHFCRLLGRGGYVA